MDPMSIMNFPTESNRHLLIYKRLSILLLASVLPTAISAKCGAVDYSWGASALASAHDFVVTMMLYVLYLIYAVGAIVVVYGSMQVYIKITMGEQGIVKDIMMLVGACLFLIGASTVFPALFGYQID